MVEIRTEPGAAGVRRPDDPTLFRVVVVRHLRQGDARGAAHAARSPCTPIAIAHRREACSRRCPRACARCSRCSARPARCTRPRCSARDGTLLCAREDVGRHNAVDKVIGWAALERRLPLAGTILLASGRLGFEIAQKALVAGIPVLAAISGPSSLAVELARENGMTLVAFLRGDALERVRRRGADRALAASGMIGSRHRRSPR